MHIKPIALSFELNKKTNGRIQLFPFGRFYSQDERTEGAGGWYVDDSNGYALADQINQLKIKLMIDYEHQTLFIKDNGKPNPAAGWMETAEYIPGEGIFVDVDWTKKAHKQIQDGEYRYISPMFLSAKDGKVTKVLNAALVNRPACHDLAEAIAFSSQFNQQQKDNSMLELLCQLFGVKDATEDEMKQKLTALSAAKGDSPVALSDVYGKLKEKDGEVVALSAKVGAEPDPSKYVPLSMMKDVQDKLAALSAQVQSDKVADLIQTALSDGRLLPSQKDWAEKLGKADVTALSDYLAVATPNQALAGGSQAKEDPNQKVVALSAGEAAAARALGMTEAEFIEEHKEKK
ncbi:hypothetical protein BKK52_10515 [Rodentibacter trehalosifermentans]|uniref:I protein n=1 Tax=Rodentibacter trehalosifermentans TaxID=1908263 RepID=A0A1V3IXB7_9PAST|nr:phage protease [Rodentibacter trehalosifermentans]OOF46935.1 hypothetical protein BKK52_10515 [Rodentibacter trehalosifermentans]